MKKFLHKIFGYIINIDIFLQSLLLLGITLIMQDSTVFYGKVILITASLLFSFIAVSPIAPFLLNFLENYHPKLDRIPDDVKGMIILGGSFNRRATIDRRMTCYNSAGGRFIHAVELANQYPHLRVVFSGRGVPLSPNKSELTESDIARSEFIKLKIDLDRVTFEDQSLNTRDNAIMSYAVVNPAATDKWLLVTSASHMPRSMGLFKKAGWNVIACPVDYHTSRQFKWQFNYRIADSLPTWLRASKEWCGLISNWLFGLSDHILPRR